MPRTLKSSRGSGALVMVGVGALLFGLMFAVVGLATYSQAQPYDDGILVTGTVIDHARSPSSDSTGWASVVEFHTEAGEPIVFVGSAYSSSRDPLGSEVRVSYRAEDPFGARNLDDAGNTLGLIFFGIGSAVILSTVIGLFFGGIKRLRSRVSGDALQSAQAPPPGQSGVDPNGWDPTQFDSSGTDFIKGEDRGF